MFPPYHSGLFHQYSACVPRALVPGVRRAAHAAAGCRFCPTWYDHMVVSKGRLRPLSVIPAHSTLLKAWSPRSLFISALPCQLSISVNPSLLQPTRRLRKPSHWSSDMESTAPASGQCRWDANGIHSNGLQRGISLFLLTCLSGLPKWPVKRWGPIMFTAYGPNTPVQNSS